MPNSFLCVSRENLSLVESGQWIFDFYKSVILKQQKQCTHLYILLFPSVRPSLRCAPYPRNLTSSDHNFWKTCKMMISSGFFFFHFFKNLGLWVVSVVKGQKMAQNDKKLCYASYLRNHASCVSFMAHLCIMMIFPGVFFFFFKFFFPGC